MPWLGSLNLNLTKANRDQGGGTGKLPLYYPRLVECRGYDTVCDWEDFT